MIKRPLIRYLGKQHAGKNRSVVRLPDISTILPPIDEPFHTLDTQYHCMNTISNTISTLNPGQIPVDTADQRIFVPTKELMIRFLDKFGPDKYFCLNKYMWSVHCWS